MDKQLSQVLWRQEKQHTNAVYSGTLRSRGCLESSPSSYPARTYNWIWYQNVELNFYDVMATFCLMIKKYRGRMSIIRALRNLIRCWTRWPNEFNIVSHAWENRVPVPSLYHACRELWELHAKCRVFGHFSVLRMNQTYHFKWEDVENSSYLIRKTFWIRCTR